MAQPGSQDQLAVGISRLDWSRCLVAMEAILAKGNDWKLDELVERIEHSGTLVVQRADAAAAARRDAFSADALAFLHAGDRSDLAARLEQHLVGVRAVEQGYHEILKTLAECNGDIPVAQHAWALLERMHYEERAIFSQALGSIREKAKKGIVDPDNMHVGQGEASYSPDAVLTGIVETVSSALKMFAYQAKWFDNRGHLTLPPRAPANKKIRFRAGLTQYLGAGWRALDFSAERWRFFGGTVTLSHQEVVSPNGPRPAEVLAFNPPSLGAELVEDLAGERLDRLLAQTMRDLKHARWPQGNPAVAGGAPLPPKSYLGVEEVFSTIGLSQILHFDIVHDAGVYQGLRLIEWNRCYRWLSLLSEAKPAHDGIVKFSRDEFLDGAVGVGVDRNRAERFVDAVTFGRDSVDLFDAPILKDGNGGLHVVGGIVRTTNVPRAVLSQLAALDVQIGRKGRALEDSVLQLLAKNGHKAAGFRLKHKEVEYDCDAAFIWDRKLFVLECKNRSFPAHKPSRVFGFFREMDHAVLQAERLVSIFTERPEIIREHLGASAEWDEVVPCVVNGIPFAIPEIEGVPVYDASALGRFFQESTVSLKVPFRLPSGVQALWRHHIAPLWSGETPTAEDLVREMRNPFQLRSLRSHYRVKWQQFQLSNDMLLMAPFVKREATELEGLLEGLGAASASAELEAIMQAVKQLRVKGNASHRRKKRDNATGRRRPRGKGRR